jgi:hypothetical protein
MSDKETKAEAEAAKADAAVAKEIAGIEESNRKAAEDAGAVLSVEDGFKKGYFGTVMSPVPNKVHMAGNEEIRAEIYQAAPYVEADDGDENKFATIETAKAAIKYSNDLATVRTHPTLRGSAVNAATGSENEAKKDSK